MPIKKQKRSNKKRFNKKRSFNMRKGMRRSSKNTLTVQRTWYAGQVVPSTVATGNFWSYVTPSLSSAGTIATTALSAVPNLTEYTSLFDSFKVSAIKLKFRPRNVDINLSQSNPSTGTTYTDVPYVSYLIDPYSTLTPSGTYSIATFNNFYAEGRAKTIRGDKEFSIYWKPKCQEQFGSGALRYINPRYASTDTAGTTMPLRGVHIFFHSYNFTGVFNQYDVYATYYMKFKGQK